MIVYSFLLLSILPFINYLFFNRKSTTIWLISIPLLSFNLLTSFFVGLLDLKYNITMPIYISFFILITISLFVLCFLKWKNNKEIITRSLLLSSFNRYLPILIGSILFFIIIIFVNSYFPDTQAYLSASTDYMNGLEPSFHDGGQINIYYKVMPQIITYSTLFGKDAAVAYYMLTPYLMFLTYSTILNEWFIDNDFNIKNIKFLLVGLSIVALGIISPFLSSFMTSGNIFPQSLILLITFFSIYKDKDSQWKTIITLSMTQFYSPTGYINGLLVSICVLIFAAIYSTIKNIILTSAALPVLSILPSYLFRNFFGCFREILFALVIVWVIALLVIYFLRKEKINKINNKLNIIVDKGWFQYTQYSIFLLVGMMVTVIFFFVYKKNYLYTKELSLLTPLIFIFISVFGILLFKRKNQITRIPTIFLLTSAISIVFILFSVISGKDNNSTWRVIYLNFGMGGPIDIIILFMLICNQLTIDFQYKKIEKSTNAELLSTTILTSLVATGFAFYNVLPTSVRLYSMSSNVNQNIFKVSNKDKVELLKLNNNSYKIFSDVQINYLLDKAINNSSIFFNDFEIAGSNNHYVSNWTISAYTLYGPINILDSKLENKDQKISDRIVQMIDNDNINSIVLDKNSLYYTSLLNVIESKFSNIYVGEGITILKN